MHWPRVMRYGSYASILITANDVVLISAPPRVDSCCINNYYVTATSHNESKEKISHIFIKFINKFDKNRKFCTRKFISFRELCKKKISKILVYCRTVSPFFHNFYLKSFYVIKLTMCSRRNNIQTNFFNATFQIANSFNFNLKTINTITKVDGKYLQY